MWIVVDFGSLTVDVIPTNAEGSIAVNEIVDMTRAKQKRNNCKKPLNFLLLFVCSAKQIVNGYFKYLRKQYYVDD